MANEELMRILPDKVERSNIPGPFHIKTYPGSHSIVVLTCELVTCGGQDSKERADELASALNEVWKKHFDDLNDQVISDIPTRSI